MKGLLGLLFGAIVGLVIGSGCCSSSRYIDSVALIERGFLDYYKSVVKLQARKKTDPNLSIYASGFAIDEKRIMTAGHFCVDVYFKQNEGTVGYLEVVQIYDDQIIIGGTIEIESIDEKKDLCILKTKWHHKIIPLKFANSYAVKIFDEVTIIGAPLGHFPVQSKGRVIQPVELDNESYLGKLKVAVYGNFGSSGGPVLNSEGKVIGVIIAKNSIDHHILFAASLFEMQEFLNE